MRERQEHGPVLCPGRDLLPREVEDAADEVIERAAGQEALMGQPADHNQEVWLDQRELPIQVRATEVDLGAAGPPVSPTPALPRNTLGDRGHVDAAPDLVL